MHGEGLRSGIEDRRLASQGAVRLQARPTRWPEDAPIGEAHESLWRIAVLFSARHGLPRFARIRAAAHDVRLQQGIAALRIAGQKQPLAHVVEVGARLGVLLFHIERPRLADSDLQRRLLHRRSRSRSQTKPHKFPARLACERLRRGAEADELARRCRGSPESIAAFDDAFAVHLDRHVFATNNEPIRVKGITRVHLRETIRQRAHIALCRLGMLVLRWCQQDAFFMFAIAHLNANRCPITLRPSRRRRVAMPHHSYQFHARLDDDFLALEIALPLGFKGTHVVF